ncbi:hypothetical protein TREMEDRAFT_66425 [Tremella mesenterica DSM 1558]|uniref:uncharacterized protein n=1 Tax=Tremella mesenterica (strain ATCC 24925 / CBS 8224 / DSM 1558 / NBRC 9311 / NRRL Y-6157 / RJB 2259-6 / UBC 559-6) TaxID=578456 RepID=UPI00032BB2BF|nr:uncharacterized protein TREMEDRAFT_66425 [Tremella mesenterica DSM 1558]EIW65595.1 hypothetical protein TREMEDRAFT_66425 [Tremella mesenterica DSM 1558]
MSIYQSHIASLPRKSMDFGHIIVMDSLTLTFSRLQGRTHWSTGTRRDDVITAGERGLSGVRAPRTCEVTSGEARDGLTSFHLERVATTIKQQAVVYMVVGYLIAELFNISISVNASHRAGSKKIVSRDIRLANW